MDIANVTIAFHDVMTQFLNFLYGFHSEHRILFYVIAFALAYGLVESIEFILQHPDAIFYILYGLIAGIAVIWVGCGPSGLDTIKTANDLVSGCIFGGIVGLVIGSSAASAAVEDNLFLFVTSFFTIPFAILTTCVSLALVAGTIIAFKDNPIQATLLFAIAGVIVFPIESVAIFLIVRE